MKKFCNMIICMLLLSGCSLVDQDTGSSIDSNPHQKEVEIPNDIPQQYKEVDKQKLNNTIPYMSKSYLELMDSVFFEGENPDDYYRKSHRVFLPGEEIVIDASSLPRDGRYEVTLLKFNRDEKKFETILEKTVNRNDEDFHIRIPDEENSSYYLREITLNTKNEVLKQEYQRIFVLYDEVNGRIDLDKTSYSPGETMEITIKNLGTVEWVTGYGVTIEKWDGEKWGHYNSDDIFIEVGVLLRSGHSFSKDYTLKEYEKGTYRVLDRLPNGQLISAAFIVE